MKRLDFLIVKEILGPWAFGVALFGSLLFAGTYLGKVAEYIADGQSTGTILQLSFLLLPAILVQTFPMAMLLAALLSFGRLSSDSEITAIRAAGVSLFRIIAPVSAFATLVALLAFITNETVVPAAAKQSAKLLDQLSRNMDTTSFKSTSYPIREKGKLKGMVVAKDFQPGQQLLVGATVVGYGEDGNPDVYLYAERLKFNPNQFKEGGGWRIIGEARFTRADGTQVLTLTNGAWPPELPELTFNIGDLLAKGLKSFELLSMGEMKEIIDRESISPGKVMSPKELRNYKYGYWNKIALPLAAFIFGTLGAALGVRNHRTGTATGFALAVAIIFAYFMIANFMNVWALNGSFDPAVASFTPIAIGLLCSGIIIWRRNA